MYIDDILVTGKSEENHLQTVDEILSRPEAVGLRLRNLVLQGWHDGEDEEILPFNRRKQELSMQDGCVLWGSRVVVPQAGRVKVL